MARPTDAQYFMLDSLPREAGTLTGRLQPSVEACLRRGWADIEDTYRYSPQTGDHRLVSSRLVLTDDGRAAHEAERQRRLEQIALVPMPMPMPSDMGAR